MFGTLKPQACGLACDRRHAYATFYCGLCKGLGDHFGTATRVLLTYDAVFLALVVDGLIVEQAAPDACRCPMLPLVHRPTVRPDSVAMRYASAMQMLLVDQFLADRSEDGKRAAKAARPLLSSRVTRAYTMLGELGVSMEEVRGFEQVQARVERTRDADVQDACEPTRRALGVAFERMTALPGVSEEATSDRSREALRELGRALGGAIYLIDALDDLAKDHASGAFNPCLVPGRRGRGRVVSWPRIARVWDDLYGDLAALDDLTHTLPLLRHRDLVRAVVVGELRRTARAAAERAHAYAKAEGERERQAMGLVARGLSSLVAAFVFAWVWLLSHTAYAQKGDAKPKDASVDATANDASAPASWLPRLPKPTPSPSESADPSSGDRPDKDPSLDPTATPPSGAPQGNADPPPTKGKGSSGRGCGCLDAFGGFRSCCNDCPICKGGDPCSSCCKCGNGKDCCNCCDACKGCDGCCK
jgi:hypothetical protein